MSQNDNAQDPFVHWTADQARAHILFDVARRFKGVDPEIDKRIDANAELISGRPGIKVIPPVFDGEPRVPLYMEGEPGVGKTSVVGGAIREFCRIVGLNYVDDKKLEAGYKPGPTDFVFTTVNLSGKLNTSDVGGLPTKAALYSEVSDRSSASEWLLSEVQSKLKAVGKFAKVAVADGQQYEKGELRALDMTVTGESANVDLVVTSVVNQLGEEIKSKGGSIALLRDGEEPQDGRLYLQLKKGTKGTRITAYAPKASEESTFVSEMLPNRRMAILGKARFALVNFDDVANASEAVRNMLLEVAQSNRYSGVMDIGKAMVTFSGNMGAEDNTNTQSEQSDAEVTRVFKVRIRDTPKDWARRTAQKYSEVGDCMFSAFIQRHGNEAGIFRDAIGDGRTARGTPKPNSRSLENALGKVLPFFQMAKASGVSPTVFSDEIEWMVKGTTGPVVATRYKAFMMAMLTEAIPLADQLMETGRMDEVKFERFMGAGAKASEQDFAFRFGTALADSFVERIAYSEGARKASAKPEAFAELITDSADRMCTGLAKMDPGTMNYTLSRIMSRLGGIAKLATNDGVEVRLTQPTFAALADGFGRSRARNIWPDAEQAMKDYTTVMAGANLSGGSKPKASRP